MDNIDLITLGKLTDKFTEARRLQEEAEKEKKDIELALRLLCEKLVGDFNAQDTSFKLCPDLTVSLTLAGSESTFTILATLVGDPYGRLSQGNAFTLSQKMMAILLPKLQECKFDVKFKELSFPRPYFA